MKSYRTLSLREVTAQRTTSLLIWIAVLLSALMTAAVGQSAGVLGAMRLQQAVALGGDRYATLVQLTEEQAAQVEEDARLSYTGRSVPVGTLELNDLLSLSLAEYGDPSVLPAYTRLAAGRLPEGPMELALPEDALEFLGLAGEVGDRITLPLTKALRHGIAMDAYDYTAEFTLVGVTKSNYLGYGGGNILGLVGRGTAATVLPPAYLYYNVDLRTAKKGDFQAVVDDWNARLGLHELDTLYNLPYLNALGIRCAAGEAEGRLDDGGFSYILLAGALAAGLILLAAGLVIYNILKVAVSRRLRQYGTLRAIGAERGQLYAVAAGEVLLLCGAGIPAGLLLGFLSAKGILTAALNQLPPESFLAQDRTQLRELIAANGSAKWGPLLLSAGITLFFAFLAAAPAVRFAARVPPVAAMAGREARIHRRGRRKIRNFERDYARLNLSRSRGRAAVTALSLAMSAAVFIVLQSAAPLLDASGSLPEHLGDYSLVNEAVGFSPEELSRLEDHGAVSAVAAEQCARYELDEAYRPDGVETDLVLGPGETFQIFGMNGCWLDYALEERLTPEQLAALKAGEGCVVRNPIPMEIGGETYFTSRVEGGSVLTVAGRALPVLGCLDGYDGYFSVGNSGFVQGVQVLVSDRLYPLLTGRENYAELRPALAPEADRAALDQALEELCRRLPGTSCVSYEQTDRQLEESGAQIRLLAWGIILLVALIGVLNVGNTVYTNIHTRTAEIGIQRALGMSAGSLYRTFLWEGAYYAAAASALGCLLGGGCTALIGAAAGGGRPLSPALPMLEASGASLAVCLVATAVPLRKLARLSIVDSIEAAE